MNISTLGFLLQQSQSSVSVGDPDNNSTNTTADGKQVIVVVGDSIYAGNSDLGTGIPDAISGAVFECDSTGSIITQISGKHIRGELNGNPWVSFANERFTSSGYKSIICNTAAAGSTAYPSATTGGGTLNTWYPGGNCYNTAINRINNCLTAAGVSKPRVIFVHLGINDEQSASVTLANIQLGIESLRSRLLAAYPGVKIVWSNFGWLALNSLTTRASNMTTARGRFIRKVTMEQARDYTDVYMGPYYNTFAQNGLNRTADIHWNDAGNTEAGKMLNRWMNNSGYSKEARAIISSHYDDISTTRKNAIETWLSGIGLTDYYKLDGYFRNLTTDVRNVYLDWSLKGASANAGGFTFIANAGVSFDGVSNTINTGMFSGSTVGGSYSSQDDTVFVQKIIEARDPGINTFAFGGALNTASYISLRQLASNAGLQWRVNETSNIHNYTGATNFQNNTTYGVVRTGPTTSGLIIGNAIVHTSTAASVANLPEEVFMGVLATNEAASTEWMNGTFGYNFLGPATVDWQNIITRSNTLDINWNL